MYKIVKTQFYFLTTLVLATILSPSLNAMEQQSMPPAQVSIVLAEERLLAPTVEVSGSVVSLNNTEISTQVSGELIWLATAGTKVKEGDIIAKISPTLLSINLQSVEAQLEKLKADFIFREQEVKRFKTLANRDNTSKARLQEESAKRNMLLQDIRVGEANLSMAKYYLSQANIRAPFSGHIVNRLANKGEYLSIGNKLIRLVDTFNKEVTLNAPMSLIPFIKNQMKVLVSSNGYTENLPINAIVPVGDSVSRMVEIRLSVTNDQWLTGAPAKIGLPSAPALKRVAIPRDALIIKGSDVFIYKITANMTAEQIKVDIGAVDGSWVAIKNKLAVNDRIVIRGGERLMPGQSVSLLPYKP